MPEADAGFEGLSLLAVQRALQKILSDAGFDDAPREARRLLECATALTSEEFHVSSARTLSTGELQSLRQALARRLSHEPLSRIRGERIFYGRSFEITPAVLDPRAETETLIDVVLQWANDSGSRGKPLEIIDVGTGSGAILVTLLAELPLARGFGTDISSDALAIARTNAARHGVAARARFALARSLDAIPGPFDVLVSNPPYIPSADIAGLEAAVREFDPKGALDGGPDGLAIYREIAGRAGLVVPAGLITFEVGAGQAAEVAEILIQSVENRFGRPWTRSDLGGHQRTVALLTQC